MHRDLVVIGCSAGCIDALGTKVLGELTEGFPAAVCIVLHTSPESPRVLVEILRPKTRLAVEYGEEGANIEPGHVYLAAPDYHLLIKDGQLGLGRGPRENRHRPAVDPLFRTAAASYGSRVIGVILTGNLDDGARGLMALKSAGGCAIVQDPADAQFPGMPKAALHHVTADYIVPLSGVAALLVRLTREELPGPTGEKAPEPDLTGDNSRLYTCPECGGPLRETNGDPLPYYRCRVGHAYSAESVLQAQRDAVEASLWAAVVALEQQADIGCRLSQDAERAGRKRSALHFRQRAENAQEHAKVVRSMLVGASPE